MSQQKSFTQRFDELLSVALLRHGMLARRSYRSWDQSQVRDEYAGLGLRSRPGRYHMEEFDSLEGARCQKCSRPMRIIDPRDETIDDWGGTFGDTERYTHAVGTLVCSGEPDKHRRYEVVLDGTLGDAVRYLDEIAEELGY